MNAADHDRETLERARYLAASTDLSSREGLALAYREQGFSHRAIAREIGSSKGTVSDYMARIAAQYGLSAIETKMPDERGDLAEVTPERLMQLSGPVREDYDELADRSIENVPRAVRETLTLEGDE